MVNTSDLLAMFSGFGVACILLYLVNDVDDDNEPPQGGLMTPVYEGI